MSERYIFPFKVMKWDALKTDSGCGIKPSCNMNAIGFIPVYDSISAMVDDHGTNINSGTFEASTLGEISDGNKPD